MVLECKIKTRRYTAKDYNDLWNYNVSVATQQKILDYIGNKGFDYEEGGKMIKLSWAEAEWINLPLDVQNKIKPILRTMKAGKITLGKEEVGL